MGYESKLYIVDKHHYKEIWGEVIAVFNLCKVPNLHFADYPATDCYIIADDGNTIVTEDGYGDPLREVPLEDVIRAIEVEIERKEHYRRFQPCLSLLKGFNPDEWENLVVLHYGY